MSNRIERIYKIKQINNSEYSTIHVHGFYIDGISIKNPYAKNYIFMNTNIKNTQEHIGIGYTY